MNNIIARITKEPKRCLAKLLLTFSFCLSDKQYLKALFMYRFGCPLDLKNPTTFCEKLQWLKLYDRRPVYSKMVDKYEVKKYVADKIGEEYIIPTLGVWNTPDDIDWNSLPDRFVLKTTHGGGGNGIIICKDKKLLDKDATIKQLHDSLNADLYKLFRESAYKNVRKRIIAEKYMVPEDNTHVGLLDYKFFCFNGKVKFFKVDFGRFIEHHANYYSMDCELLEFGEKGMEPDPNADIHFPENLQEMIELAEYLSNDLPFIRVDLYNINGKIYFGELTFYPAAGFGKFIPEEWNEKIGSLIKLNTSNKI